MSLEATDLASGLNDTPAGWSTCSARWPVPNRALRRSCPDTPLRSSRPGRCHDGQLLRDRRRGERGDGAHARRQDRWCAPVLSGLPSEGCTLWPLDHKLQRVAVLRASDAVSGIARGSFQVNATSNEPMDPSDVAVTEDENGGLVVELRAERSGGSKSGRVYHLTVRAQDLAGNEVTGTTCIVPRQGRGEVVAGRVRRLSRTDSLRRRLRQQCPMPTRAEEPRSRTAYTEEVAEVLVIRLADVLLVSGSGAGSRRWWSLPGCPRARSRRPPRWRVVNRVANTSSAC